MCNHYQFITITYIRVHSYTLWLKQPICFCSDIHTFTGVHLLYCLAMLFQLQLSGTGLRDCQEWVVSMQVLDQVKLLDMIIT